jgi:hypothetical protein
MNQRIIFFSALIYLFSYNLFAQLKIQNLPGSASSGSSKPKFTEADAAAAIKEALTKGAVNAVNTVGVKDGYFKNQFIKIPFPPEAKAVENTLRQVGAGQLADRVIESLNRAAEDAAQAAKPIFINAIKQLTVTDAINIVTGSQRDAATRFLQRTTTNQLITAFKPAIKNSLDKTLATKYWAEATTRYNKVPFVKKVNTDLPDYTTRKALDGLFYMIAKEEAKIRQNPKQYGSTIIDKVFGAVFN